MDDDDENRVLAVLYLEQYLDSRIASANSQEVLEKDYLQLHWIADINKND